MQVKKFEARTMKEALEMVKSQLGPDAIILSARDNNRSFGLVGEGSVEITAAVSEETLHKKKFVESRINDRDKDRFSKSSAKVQKTIIEKMVQKHLDEQHRPVTRQRYIEIDDTAAQAANQAAAPQPTAQSLDANQRIKNAAQRAWSSFSNQTWQEEKAAAKVEATQAEAREIIQLKNEIAGLKDLLSKFENVPQQFAGAYPGQNYGLPYELSFMFERLMDAGVSEEITADILNHIQETTPIVKLKNKSLIEGWVAKHILETTQTTNQMAEKIHIFMGGVGSGKTSQLVKMASHLVVKKNKKVALFTTDTFKVGAAEQLKIYAQILNVPFAIIRSSDDWGKIVKFLSQVDCVLVDCPSFSLKNSEEIEKLRSVLPNEELGVRSHFVVSAMSKDSDTEDLARRYSVFGFDDVIFTAVDQSLQHGTIYNFMRRHNCPIHSFGIGPRIPEDFELATRERVLDLLLKITQAQNEDASL
jgi:flagellar biosynthesis protein FlhF